MTTDFQVPRITAEKADDRRGTFTIEPLDKGFGYTFGNSLRRVLLSSLGGAAITSVRIEGVAHEFSTVPGVKEDVTDIVLNLKDLVVRMHTDADEVEAPLVATGPGEVKAKDIDLPSGVEILNPEAPIATLEKKTKLEVYLTIGRGRGYSPAEENKSDEQPIGVIPIDSIFSPIRRASYAVATARVGQRTDFDKLTLDLETDGSIEPAAALREASEILIKSLAIFTDAERVEELTAREPDRRPADRSARRTGRRRRRRQQRSRRDPDRGARTGSALLQLPEAGRRADGRRPGSQVALGAERDPQLRPEVDRGSDRDPALPRPRPPAGLGSLRAGAEEPVRHRKKRNKLSRDAAHREALLANLSKQLIEHERIKTSQAKAKAVKPEVEQLITLAKRGDLHARRQALATLHNDKFIVHKLFDEVAPRYSERPGRLHPHRQARAAARRTRPRWST